MIIFTITVFALIFIISFYLVKELKKRILLSIFLISSSTVAYLLKGNLESFFFVEKNEEIIENIIVSESNFEKLDPKRLIFYLENKLKNNPNDLKGWLLLARTCNLTGYLQKADLYFKKGLKYFPYNENLLFEYALLKKNSNQLKSSLEILQQLKLISPENISIREIIIDIYIALKNKELARREIESIKRIKGVDLEEVLNIINKYNL